MSLYTKPFAGYNTEDGITINPLNIIIGLYNAANYNYVSIEQDEQLEQDRIEKEKIKQSILSNPPYGLLDEVERTDINLLARQMDVSTIAAAVAYLVYEKDFVAAGMSLIE